MLDGISSLHSPSPSPPVGKTRVGWVRAGAGTLTAPRRGSGSLAAPQTPLWYCCSSGVGAKSSAAVRHFQPLGMREPRGSWRGRGPPPGGCNRAGASRAAAALQGYCRCQQPRGTTRTIPSIPRGALKGGETADQRQKSP